MKRPLYTREQIQEAIDFWQRQLDESHPPVEDRFNKDGTFDRNWRDILRKEIDTYGSGYTADAFVAFAKEMSEQDPELAKKTRRFLGQFAAGQFNDKYDGYGDDAGKCSAIAKALAGLLGAALSAKKQ